jgi:hypothetical protein
LTRLECLLETANSSLSCSCLAAAVAVTVVAALTTTVAAAVVVDVERAFGSTVEICFDCVFAVAVGVVVVARREAYYLTLGLADHLVDDVAALLCLNSRII